MHKPAIKSARNKGHLENIHRKVSEMAKVAGISISAVTIAQILFDDAFSRPRDPRSNAYKDGVLATLKFRLASLDLVNPYAPGSPERDAFFAGTEEGHRISSQWRDEIGPAVSGAL